MYTDIIIQHLASMCEVPTDLKVLETRALGDAVWVLFAFDGETQVAVYYPQDDMLFAPDDWQGGHPGDPDDIANWRWVSSAGDEAIVLDGLPRAFPAVRDQARKDFGRALRAAREGAGMTQDELAFKSGLARTHIIRIEAGRYNVTLDTITRLRAALGEF